MTTGDVASDSGRGLHLDSNRRAVVEAAVGAAVATLGQQRAQLEARQRQRAWHGQAVCAGHRPDRVRLRLQPHKEVAVAVGLQCCRARDADWHRVLVHRTRHRPAPAMRPMTNMY